MAANKENEMKALPSNDVLCAHSDDSCNCSPDYIKGTVDERAYILKLLDTPRACECKEGCRTDIHIVAFILEELGINIFSLLSNEKRAENAEASEAAIEKLRVANWRDIPKD
jgi:hypothetical protein